MRVTINIDCSPAEARSFLGLPNLEPLNDLLVARVSDQVQSNMDMLDPQQLMNNWFAMGGAMREQFLNAMTSAASGASDEKDDE